MHNVRRQTGLEVADGRVRAVSGGGGKKPEPAAGRRERASDSRGAYGSPPLMIMAGAMVARRHLVSVKSNAGEVVEMPEVLRVVDHAFYSQYVSSLKLL